MGFGEHLRSVVDEQELHCRLPCVHVSAPELVWSRGPGKFAGSRRMRAATIPLAGTAGAHRCDTLAPSPTSYGLFCRTWSAVRPVKPSDPLVTEASGLQSVQHRVHAGAPGTPRLVKTGQK